MMKTAEADLERIMGVVRLYLYSSTESPGFNVPVPSLKSLQMQLFTMTKHAQLIGAEFDDRGYDPYGSLVRGACEACSTSGEVDWDGSGPLCLPDSTLPAAGTLWNATDEKLRGAMTITKDLMNEMSHEEMISYVYATFPEEMDGAPEHDTFEKCRVEAAVSLFKRRTTVAKSARISGLGYEGFIAMLADRGIPAFWVTKEDLEARLGVIERINRHQRLAAR
ncbi:MAG: UPF0175 family protein [Nitrosopumilus sp.]|nr:UPF0175 family protein [Nitrosopumilus sp.]MDA7943253.1 UPF0175 family protein [Nitrosopumilus sp.]MDA7952347.1 UPF0175 family protein [Nitrosopumilus sp.]MDA7957485.1 UPF0175 family protein [Nitrosopumilus sp.]MDA7998237.1 UPF0175 family protein [Nitrosopumilus sp.]